MNEFGYYPEEFSYMKDFTVIDLLEDLKDAANDIAYDAGQANEHRYVNRMLKIKGKIGELLALLDELDAREEVIG